MGAPPGGGVPPADAGEYSAAIGPGATGYHGPMSALLAALLSVASVCTSVDEAKAVTQVKRAFHPARATADSLDEKRAALEGIAPFDSAKVARVLVTAYGVLEHEAEPLEEARRPFLDNRGGKKMLTYRMQLKPIRALQNTMRSQLLRLKNPDAIRGQVRLLVRGKVSPPHGLKRVLAFWASFMRSSHINDYQL